MESQVEVEDMASVGVENEVMYFTLGTWVKVWLVRGNADDDVDVSMGLTTMYDAIVVGEGVVVTSTVFAGSNSLTIFVATTVSIDGGVLLAGAVTVLMLSDV